MLTRYQVGAAGSHGLGTTDRTRSNMPTRYQDGAADLTLSEQLIQHAYKVSGRGCRISQIRNTISYMPTGYQDRAADLTGKEHQIVHAYEVSR